LSAQPPNQKDKWHRVLQLKDTTGDGQFDQRSVFATFDRLPQGSQWLDGSLYVASPPIIWKLTDGDNDGVAEKQEKWVEQPDTGNCLNDSLRLPDRRNLSSGCLTS
jgi:glucose/arabinose dehydrogenase